MRGRIHALTIAAFVAVASAMLLAQATHVSTSGTLPTNCRVGDVYNKTGASAGFYRCSATNTWTAVGSGSGDVVGPSSATADRIAVFDGTTGKLIKDGGQTIAGITAGAGGVVLITETVTSGSASNVTFSSISSSYRDLKVHVRGRGTTAATDVEIRLQFNGDTGNNYSTGSVLTGTGVIASNSINTSAITAGFIPASTGLADAAGLIEVLIGDYRGTTFFKATTGRATDPKDNVGGNFLIWILSGMWKSTSAINSVKVYPSAGNFVDGTVVSLYGVM